MAKCVVCGGEKFRELVDFDTYPLCIGVVPEKLKKELKSFPLKIGACLSCSHIQQIQGVSQDYNDAMYKNESSEMLSSVPTPSLTGIGRGEAQKCFEFFKSCALPKGKVVDIGCYDGYFLSLVKKEGYDVLGVEPNPISKIAEEKYGIPIVRDYFPSKEFKEKSVDIFVLRNILEHLSDPHVFLKEIQNVLKDGGHIVIEVPDMYYHFGMATLGGFFHQHVSCFSLYSILRLLQDHSMEYVSSRHGYALCLCVKKKSGKISIPGKADRIVDKEIEAFLAKYGKIKKDLMDIMDRYSNIAVFGAGGHTAALLYMLGKKYVDKIKHIYDNNQMKYGSYTADFNSPVKGADSIKADKPDLIIISTGLYQDAILDQLRCLKLEKADIAVIYPEVKMVGK